MKKIILALGAAIFFSIVSTAALVDFSRFDYVTADHEMGTEVRPSVNQYLETYDFSGVYEAFNAEDESLGKCTFTYDIAEDRTTIYVNYFFDGKKPGVDNPSLEVSFYFHDNAAYLWKHMTSDDDDAFGVEYIPAEFDADGDGSFRIYDHFKVSFKDTVDSGVDLSIQNKTQSDENYLCQTNTRVEK